MNQTYHDASLNDNCPCRYLKFADYMVSGIYAHRWVWPLAAMVVLGSMGSTMESTACKSLAPMCTHTYTYVYMYIFNYIDYICRWMDG